MTLHLRIWLFTVTGHVNLVVSIVLLLILIFALLFVLLFNNHLLLFFGLLIDVRGFDKSFE